MLDEISLTADFSYNLYENNIIGFEQLENSNKLLFEDHTLVFMVKLIIERWKQPVAFNFLEGGVKNSDLKSLILDVLNLFFSLT